MLDEHRGTLPYQLIHGEALVTVATWALEQAEVEVVDQRVAWDELAERGEPLVLHDALCPMTPPEFLARCAGIVAERGVVVVGVRPVTDTVKRLAEGQVGATVDRDSLVGICSPVVLPPDVVATLPDGPPTTELVGLTRWLRERYDVELVEAPEAARRVASAEDLRVLAALTAP